MPIWRTISSRAVLGLPLIACLAIAACGTSKKSSSPSSPSGASLGITISETGGKASYTVPTSAKGGLATVTLKNNGKAPHTAQLVLLEGGHHIGELLKLLSGNSGKTPSWFRAVGGVATTAPGQTGTATITLPAGRYGVFDLPGGPSNGPPASSEFTVTPGAPGSLPSTSTQVTAATAGKDKYSWQISGSLQAGSNRITFASKGTNALHQINAFQITGHHSKAEIEKALQSNGPPPSWVKVQTSVQTAVFDGGRSGVTDITLSSPGRYVLFCPLTDRDGGKPHFLEGLLKTVTVK